MELLSEKGVILAIIHLALLLFLIGRSPFPVYAFSNTFFVFYSICFFGGYIGSRAIFFLNGTFKSLTEAQLFDALLLSIAAYWTLLFGYFAATLLGKKRTLKIFPDCSEGTLKGVYLLMIAASALSMIAFIAKSGGPVLLKGGGYEDRYLYNLGAGYLTLFFPMYISGLLIWFFLKPTIKRWRLAILHSVALGVITYVSLGGYRQLAVGGIAILCLAGLRYGHFRLRSIFLYAPIAVVGINLLAYLRYRNELEVVSPELLTTLLLYFSLDSFAPIDSFANILVAIPKFIDYQYASVFINHFLALIPRFIWETKPELLLNSGNFYTQNILFYDKDVTISSTLNGELYIMGGVLMLIVGMFFIGALLRMLDTLFIDNQNTLTHAFTLSSAFLTLWLVREGLEVFLYRGLVLYLLFIFFIGTALLLRALLAKYFRSLVTPKPHVQP